MLTKKRGVVLTRNAAEMLLIQFRDESETTINRMLGAVEIIQRE